MPLLLRKMALLAKIETTYGTDSTPTGAANAVLARNVRIKPITMTREERNLYLPYLGNSSDVIGARWGEMSFDVEAAGAGAAGSVPGYGPLLRACGLAQVTNAGVSVVYTPVSGSVESVSMYYHLDGVLHRFMGVRGDVGFRGDNRMATMFGFSFKGLFVPVTDAGLPGTTTLSGFVPPLAMNKANTPTFVIHSVSGAILKSFSLALNNQVVYRNLVNSEAVRITDRKPAGGFVMGAELMAVKNWFQTVENAATGAVQLVHGTAAGNIVEINAPAMQLNDVNYEDFEGDAMLSGTSKFMPVSGNDEFSITVR